MCVIKLASCNYGFEKEFILTHIINIASLGTEVMSSLHKYPCKWDSLFYSEVRLIFIFYWKVSFALNVLHWQTSQYEDKFSRMLNFKWKKLIDQLSIMPAFILFINILEHLKLGKSGTLLPRFHDIQITSTKR